MYDNFQTEFYCGFFRVICLKYSNVSLINPLPEYLLKELPAITALFKLHEGTTNTQHKRESTA